MHADEHPLTVVFVRHAEAEEGDGDKLGPPLTARGRRQARDVALRLSGDEFDAAYSSDLVRAKATAETIPERHSHTPLTVTPALREVGNEHYVAKADPPSDAERERIAAERDCMERFANQLRHGHGPGERVLVVSHGNFVRSLIPILAGADPRDSILIEVRNASVTRLEVWPSGRAVLTLANCVGHVTPDDQS